MSQNINCDNRFFYSIFQIFKNNFLTYSKGILKNYGRARNNPILHQWEENELDLHCDGLQGPTVCVLIQKGSHSSTLQHRASEKQPGKTFQTQFLSFKKNGSTKNSSHMRRDGKEKLAAGNFRAMDVPYFNCGGRCNFRLCSKSPVHIWSG